MASVSVGHHSPGKDSEDSYSHDSSVCSKVNDEEGLDGYESADSGDSKHSVTSARKDYEGLIGPFVYPQATNARVLDQVSNGANSAYTSWTDEKHSSYLNSMEATFVQKMYDKEYCSLDVCGRSGHSSVTFEQDCVESHPVHINKSQQQPGGFTYGGSCRPCSIGSSVFASPWIQHFKSKQPAPVGKEKRKVQKLPAPGAGSWNHCFFKETMKKRGVSFTVPDCRQSVTQCSGHGESTQNMLGGRVTNFKKVKCQQKLSHMDMEMEGQAIRQQRNNKYADVDPANEEDHQKMAQENHLLERKSPKSDNKGVTEIESTRVKESIAVVYERELQKWLVNELPSSMKVDQVVPFLKDGVMDEAHESGKVAETLMESSNVKGGLSLSPKQVYDLAQAKNHAILKQVESGLKNEWKAGLGRDSTELESASKKVSSHTWTWDGQGQRHQFNNKKPQALSKQ